MIINMHIYSLKFCNKNCVQFKLNCLFLLAFIPHLDFKLLFPVNSGSVCCFLFNIKDRLMEGSVKTW